MVDYYGNPRYGSTYVYRDSSEYPGYDSSWVLGRETDTSYYQDPYHRPPSYASSHYYPLSRPGYYPDSHYDQTHARLAWATEIPTRLRVTICCEGCKMKMDDALRDLHGVHDVGIAGWSNALVTVTGTASPHKILKEVRKVSASAELWDDPHEHGSHYSHGHRRVLY